LAFLILLVAAFAAGFVSAEEAEEPLTTNGEAYRTLFPRLILPETVRVEEAIRPGEWADLQIPIRNDGEGTLILRRVNTG
jgi:hypothetical protein